MNDLSVPAIIEAVLLAADEPMTIAQLHALFEDDLDMTKEVVEAALTTLAEQCASPYVVLQQTASGYQLQVSSVFTHWLQKLWKKKTPRYSRALLETLALIVYRQPITRTEIEDIRGVAVSPTILKTLLEREWVRVVGQKEVPGRPALYATTKAFLDYFNLKRLDELPPLPDVADFDQLEKILLTQAPALAQDTLIEPISQSLADELGESVDAENQHQITDLESV